MISWQVDQINGDLIKLVSSQTLNLKEMKKKLYMVVMQIIQIWVMDPLFLKLPSNHLLDKNYIMIQHMEYTGLILNLYLLMLKVTLIEKIKDLLLMLPKMEGLLNQKVLHMHMIRKIMHLYLQLERELLIVTFWVLAENLILVIHNIPI